MKKPSYDLRRCDVATVADLCRRYHGYKSCPPTAVYAFAVYEEGRAVAGYLWNACAPGTDKLLSPGVPGVVLALTRMAAVPRSERRLNHVSKPLRRQMRVLIDRGRWPVLVTYSDSWLGHKGHVYKCSGWERTAENTSYVYVGEDGERKSSYRCGATNTEGLTLAGTSTITRWEHWVCDRDQVAAHVASAGWERVAIPGKRWRSGAQAMKWERADRPVQGVLL